MSLRKIKSKGPLIPKEKNEEKVEVKVMKEVDWWKSCCRDYSHGQARERARSQESC